MEAKTERYTKLFSLGMSKNWLGFSFHDIGINKTVVDQLSEEEWNETLEQLTISVETKKRSLESKNKSDHEKLEDFVKSLGQITGPELKDAEARATLEGALHLIKTARDYVVEQLQKQKDLSIN